MPNERITRFVIWRSRVTSWSARFAAFLATGRARAIIVSIFFIGILLLTYQHVWRPVRDVVPLPPGISERNPVLNEELLKTINTQRVERVDEKLPPFSVGALFRPRASTQ